MNNIVLKVSNFLPFDLLKYANQKVIFPFYHSVSDNISPHLLHLYPVKSIKKFVNDLEFLLKKYKPISLNDYISSENKNAFLLTFDDGLIEIYDTIAPILKQKGIPAVFFVNSAFVDNKDLFFRYKASIIIDELLKKNSKVDEVELYLRNNNIFSDNIKKSLYEIGYSNSNHLDVIYNFLGKNFSDYLKISPVYLSKNHIKKLLNQGFDVGAHSVNHIKYNKCSVDKQIAETVNSLTFVKENFNPQYSTFAFPFTDDGVSKTFFDKLFSENHVDLTFGTAGIKNDVILKNIQRIPMENGFSAKRTLKYQYFAYFLKGLMNKNLIKR